MKLCVDPTESVAVYKDFLDQRRCWIDATVTHGSSRTQRQCPKCRTKWSYDRLAVEFAVLESFCSGASASRAAAQGGCVKNTALGHFRDFRQCMESLIVDGILEGTIATNPVTLGELRSFEKALRAGSLRRREKACRHLFLSSLSFEERLEGMFRRAIVPDLRSRISMATLRIEGPGVREVADVRYAQSVGPLASVPRSVAPKSPVLRSQSTTAPEILPVPTAEPTATPRRSFRKVFAALWRGIRARFDPECPYPSAACKRMGVQWVRAWGKARELRRGKNAAKT